jgi:hypothetical protein
MTISEPDYRRLSPHPTFGQPCPDGANNKIASGDGGTIQPISRKGETMADTARHDTAQQDSAQQDNAQQDTLKPDTGKPDTLKPEPQTHGALDEPVTEAIPSAAQRRVDDEPVERRDDTDRLFDRRWRGYDRDQVEEYLTFLQIRNVELVSRLAELDAARHHHAARADRAEQRARAASTALAQHRRNAESQQQRHLGPHQDEDQQQYQEFTRRLQKLLRVAADDAEEIRADARRDAQQHRDALEAELATLRQARDELRDQLSRLHDLLANQLAPPTPAQPRPSPKPHTTPKTATLPKPGDRVNTGGSELGLTRRA